MQMCLEVYESRSGQRQRMLNLLKSFEFIPTAMLRQFSYQYNARIFELRKMGYEIIAMKDENGRCGFMLTGLPKSSYDNTKTANTKAVKQINEGVRI